MIVASIVSFLMAQNINEIGTQEYIYQTQGYNVTSAQGSTSILIGNETTIPSTMSIRSVVTGDDGGSSGWLSDMFSIMVWNISISDPPAYWWLFRIFIIWLPFIMLLLAIYYSLPFV